MNIPNEVVWILVAILGGAARYFDRYLKGEETLLFVRLISTIIVTGFTGYMCAQVILLLYPQWVTIGAGVGGYAGTQIMDMIFELVKLKLGDANKVVRDESKPSATKPTIGKKK
jgi:hypothetical protein